jgi:dTDP-4-dehydrorhamnose 3,5-epimerase
VKFRSSRLPGAFVVEAGKAEDERGLFARTYCQREFAEQGIPFRIAQSGLAVNRLAGTLRGLHYQVPPHAEKKLVSCVRGEAFDVIVDLRLGSATRRQWLGVVLSGADGRALYVPEGFAHGYITLADETILQYHMSEPFHPPSARGLRWDDPALAIEWPRTPMVISDRDRSLPLLGAGEPDWPAHGA